MNENGNKYAMVALKDKRAILYAWSLATISTTIAVTVAVITTAQAAAITIADLGCFISLVSAPEVPDQTADNCHQNSV